MSEGANVAAVTAVLGGDTTAFNRSFEAAEGKTSALERSMAQLEETIASMGAGTMAAMQDMAGAIREVAASVGEVQDAASNGGGGGDDSGAGLAAMLAPELGIRQLKRLGAAVNEMIKDAAAMDPKAAKEWNEHMEAASNAVKTFAGHLGQALMPALEGVLNIGVQVFATLNKFDFKKLGADIAYVARTAWDALKELGEFIVDWDIKIAKALMSPFQQMKDTLLKSITDAMGALAAVQDFAKSHLGVGSGGDSTRMAAESMKAAFEGDIADGLVKTLKETFASGADLLAKGLKGALGATNDRYMTGSGESFDFGKKKEGGGFDRKAVETELTKAIAEVNKQLDAQHAKDIAAAQRVADTQLKGIEQADTQQRKNDADALKRAEEGAKAAEKELGKATKSGSFGDIDAAQKAVEVAFGRVQAAAAVAVDTDQKQLESMEIASRLMNEGSSEREAAEARIAALREKMVNDEHRLEQVKADNLKRAQETAAKAGEFYEGTAVGMGKKALGPTGDSVVAAGMQGSVAGPIGAIVGVAAALLEASEGFKKLTASIEGIFQSAADAVGSILAPLAPALEALHKALGPVLKAVSEVLTPVGQIVAAVVQPVAGIISVVAKVASLLLEPFVLLFQAIAPIIGPIAEVAALMLILTVALNPLMAPILAMAAAALLLRPVFQMAADVLKEFMTTVSMWWNSVISALQKFINDAAGMLPDFLGNPLREVGKGLDGFKLAVDGAGAAVKGFADRLTAAVGNAQSDAEKEAVIRNALAYAKANHANKATIDDLQGQEDAATTKLNADIERTLAAAAFGRGDTEGGYKLLGEALAYETAATHKNTAAVTELTQSMSNIPAIFKTAQVVNQVLSGQFDGNGQSTGGGGFRPPPGATASGLSDRIQNVLNGSYSEVTINGDVHVTADSEDVFAALKKKLAKDRVTRTGTSPRDPSNRWNLALGG